VSDTGIGIAEDAQRRIFESFAQADETIINRYGGTGLGLAIVRQLVELHGGAIAVESRVGVGSTFSFELPFERRTAQAEQSQDRAAFHPIVVSRSEDVQLAFKAALLRDGVEARLVASLDEAIALIDASGSAHAAVVLDERASRGMWLRRQRGCPPCAARASPRWS
jgi:two-component system sensor histidine kinase RpfC